MSYNINDLFVARNSRSGSYQIEQSLRFNNPTDTHYLNRTPSTDGNRRTFTYSGWHKFVGMPDASNNRRIFGARSANTDSGWFSFHMRPDGDNRLEVQLWNHSVNVDNRIRDFSAWYHLVLAVDTTQATATDRVKVYINGVQATYTNNSGSGISGFSQNLDLAVNDNAAIHNIGNFNNDTGGTNMMPMYAAEIHFVDGTALDQYDFGEFDDNGVWRPINVSGLTYGTNGYYLNFSNSSDLGEDQAGSNDWTANNFTTSGTGTDVMDDTPTKNWATLNAIDPSPAPLSEGNLKVTGTNSGWSHRRSTFAMSSGKWYWEDTISAVNYIRAGVVKAGASFNENVGQNADGWGFQAGPAASTAQIFNNDSGTNYGTTVSSGETLGFAFDADTGKMWVRNSSGFMSSGDPVAGTNPAMTAGAGTYFAAGSGYETTEQNLFNFGQRAFAYTPPTGFSALNTSNLPAPDIADGSQYFNTILWTGNGGQTRSLTGVGFQSDFTWMKRRDAGQQHMTYDAVRGAGAGKMLVTNATAAEGSDGAGYTDSQYGYISSFDTDGFSVNDGASSTTGGWVNSLNHTYVAWNWLASNTSGSSNTAGSITSTVSANPTAGFSIITYTGNGTGGATVGHGLGVAPSMVIFKNRDGGEWVIYNKVIGATKNVILSAINKAGTYSGWFNNTEPTSNVLSLGSDADVNRLNDDIVAYCFAEVEGYSKFGSYTGNGSASDGPFVWCGLRPAMVIIKNITTNSNWIIRDSARSLYNPVQPSLYPNLEDGEISNFPMDFLSNGFKIRDDNGVFNTSGDDYIFMAWAENPFGGEGVSPATAR